MSPSELQETYDDGFFESLATDVAGSAEVVVPIVVDLVRPASVLDVGCGRGTWLRVFREHGVHEILGVDGPHVPVADLEIARDAFIARDLRHPIALERRFDLVVSLEVAEHLDASIAPTFVASLVNHGPAVLFSAAIPFQGGAGHVNEAWQSSWAAIFAEHDFVPLDVIRPVVWHDDRVAFWYAQNTLLYVDRDHVDRLDVSTLAAPGPLDVVHPALHVRTHTTPPPSPAPPSLSRVLRDLPSATRRAVRRRLPTRRDVSR